MPLSEMLLQGLAQSGDIGAYQERLNRRQMQEYELLEKQRQLQDAQRLRELYASGRQPSMQEVMSVSPQLGIEMQKANFANSLQLQQMQKLQREQQEANAKTYAQYVGPIADTYFDDISSGMKPEMAIQKYHSSIGSAQKDLEEKHGIAPTGDFRSFSPEQVLERSTGLGVPSRHFARQEELQKRMLPPAMTAEQAYGGVDMGPYGPRRKPPIARDNFGPAVKATADDLPALQNAYDQATDVNKKQRIGALINQLKAQTGFVTPEQEMRLRAEEAGAKKTAQIEAEEAAADKKALDTYFRGHPPEEIRNIISQSLEGDVQTGIARLGKVFGVSVEGSTPTAALKVITQQMIANSPYPPGSQSNVEYEARLQKIGNPASDEPIKDRLAAINEVYRDQEAFVSQKYKPESVEDILDKRQQGYISEDTARKLYKKLKSKSGKL